MAATTSESMIWLAEIGKIIVLHVRRAHLSAFHLRSLPNGYVKILIMIFLTVVACEIGRNRYFAGTGQTTGSGVWWELWVISRTNIDPLGI